MEYHDDKPNEQSIFEIIAEGDEGRCKLLWLSVLLQQILDAKGKFGKSLTQAQARIWLEGREGIHSGLYEVCAYAGIDFEKTRKRCAELLEDDAEVVDFRMAKRDKEKNQTIKNRRRYYRRAEQSKRQRLSYARNEVKGFVSGDAANDNSPIPSNDNLPEHADCNLINSSKEKNHEQ